MNVTGMSQYSKETSIIKDPKKIMDSQQKLIFIYPMLFADKIKVQNVQSFETLMRDFIAVTFLSDMFVQNLFSVIGTANQIRPLWDERNTTIDPTTSIIRAMAAQQGAYAGGNSLPNYPVGSEHSNILQNKISQKTAIIQRLLKVDPKMSKLRPYVEIVTMGNMIDVPVIVGTVSYPVDTLTLMYVLIAAIGMNRKLNNTQDLDFIFKELESMNEKKYWALLNNLIKTKQDSTPSLIGSPLEYFQDKSFKILHKVSGWNSLPRSITSTARNQAARLQKRIDNPPQFEQQRQIFAPLLLKQHDLDSTKMYFKFVLDEHFARTRFGIDVSNETSKLSHLSQTKLQGKLSQIQNVTMGGFAELVGTLGSSLLRSMTNLISIDNPTVNYTAEKTRNIDTEMIENVDPILNEILISVDNGLKGNSVEESRNKIKILDSLCDIKTIEHLNDFIDKTVQNSVIGSDFTETAFRNFNSTLDAFSDVSKSLSLKVENEIRFITSNQERSALELRFNNLEQEISQSLSKFFRPFIEDLSNDPNANNSPLARVAINDNKQPITSHIIPAYITSLKNIFYFCLMSKLQASLCHFVLTADVDLEMAKNEVTSWPNYTLVLPVEIVLALHAALMGMSWEHLLRGGNIGTDLKTKTTRTTDASSKTQITVEKNKPLTRDQASSLKDVSESYIKPAIKYIAIRLDVPNLIVVDSKKGEIYYKLMNQTDVNKTKIATIGTFIDSKVNHPMTQQY